MKFNKNILMIGVVSLVVAAGVVYAANNVRSVKDIIG